MQQKAMAFGCCMSFGGTSGRRRGTGHAAGPATAPPERRTCTTGRGTPTLPDGSKRPPRCSVAILCDSSAAATHRRHRWSCGVHHTEPGGGRNSRFSGRAQGLPTSIGAGAPGGRLRTICRPVSEISASRRNCACSRLTAGLLPAPGAARDARQVDRQDGDRSASSPAQAETVSRRTYCVIGWCRLANRKCVFFFFFLTLKSSTQRNKTLSPTHSPVSSPAVSPVALAPLTRRYPPPGGRSRRPPRRLHTLRVHHLVRAAGRPGQSLPSSIVRRWGARSQSPPR